MREMPILAVGDAYEQGEERVLRRRRVDFSPAVCSNCSLTICASPEVQARNLTARRRIPQCARTILTPSATHRMSMEDDRSAVACLLVRSDDRVRVCRYDDAYGSIVFEG